MKNVKLELGSAWDLVSHERLDYWIKMIVLGDTCSHMNSKMFPSLCSHEDSQDKLRAAKQRSSLDVKSVSQERQNRKAKKNLLEV